MKVKQDNKNKLASYLQAGSADVQRMHRDSAKF
jgi:hypothetical protein